MHELFLRKTKKHITITDALQKKLGKSNQKPNIMWIDKSSAFYNRSMKSGLQDDIEMYSTHNEGKSKSCEGSFKNHVCWGDG